MNRITIIHQHDPSIDYPGGIGTFVRSLIKYAPPEFEVELVGICADSRKHPVGSWKEMKIGERSFRFLPILHRDLAKRSGIPVSLQFTWALRHHQRLIDFHGTVLHFHRIEPSLALKKISCPMILFLHAHPNDLHNLHSEVTWARFPWLYSWLERKALPKIQRIFIVREDAVSFYRDRYLRLADRFSFLTTWVDDAVFFPLAEARKDSLKAGMLSEIGAYPGQSILLFVGRFEGQKDPLLLLRAFEALKKRQEKVILILIGTGMLEPAMRRHIRDNGFEASVRILGPQPQVKIAQWMNIADCLCLSSAFEGMPMVVIEALQCGLPVVSTDAGEARRLVNSSTGRLVPQRSPESLSQALAEVLATPPSREACQKQVAPFLARTVLKPVYEYCLSLRESNP